MDAELKAVDTPARAWRWGHLALAAAVVAGWLGLSGINAWMGELNQDEG